MQKIRDWSIWRAGILLEVVNVLSRMLESEDGMTPITKQNARSYGVVYTFTISGMLVSRKHQRHDLTLCWYIGGWYIRWHASLYLTPTVLPRNQLPASGVIYSVLFDMHLACCFQIWVKVQDDLRCRSLMESLTHRCKTN